MAVLLAGLPTSIPATTINRLCGSSLDAAMIPSRGIETGDAKTILVGGVESVSRAPDVLLNSAKPYAIGDQTLHSTTLGWRMVNPQMPSQWTISLGASTEKLAGIHHIERGMRAVAPDIFGIAPVEAANRALVKAGIGWDQVEVVELRAGLAVVLEA